MTEYVLRDGTSIEIEAYEATHAESIASDLFQGASIETILQQRSKLLAPGQEEAYSVCTILNSRVIGVCTGVRGRWFGMRHRIELVQVVVDEDARGLGIARYMMTEIARHFKKYGVEIIEIQVASDNVDALLAYTKIGFKQYGVLQNGLKYDSQYLDELSLAIPLSELLRT